MQRVLAMLLPEGNEDLPSHQQQQQQGPQDSGKSMGAPQSTPCFTPKLAADSSSASSSVIEDPAMGLTALHQPEVITYKWGKFSIVFKQLVI